MNYKWIINRYLKGSGLIILIFAMVSSLGLKAQEIKQDGTQDTVIVKPKIKPGTLYELIQADPRNRKYLEMGKQGWISGLGGNTFLRFGGFVQANFISDFQNTGYSFGEFIPALHPVPTEKTHSMAFDPRSTRITFETQTDTKHGYVHTFVGMDFNGFAQQGTIQPRLRQAYVAWINANNRQSLLVGQAGTTIYDGDVWPEEFDLEGPNALLYLRQVMIRYTFMLTKSDQWIGSIALEEPNSLIQGGQGIEHAPDLIFTANWQQKWGHLRLGALGRWLSAERNNGTGKDESFGWGLTFSGQVMVPNMDDNFQFQLYGGQGMGRYILDPGSASSGQDAVYDNIAADLTPLSTYGGFIAYQHWWIDKLRSNVIAGYTNMVNQAIQANDALNHTTYVTVNTLYSPFSRLDLGLEYYYGKRVNKSDDSGHANRLMLAVKYAF